ncbi:H-hydrate dehydratase [Xylariaceae sp. FL1019]|nr:H-hydrate dehydratase [Xylariaceae sp. FL1019]
MSDQPGNMSSATRDVLSKVRQLVPPMLEKFHKGQLGRVAVIGGSEDYTGAPYFSAMASARLGCDMSHVICTPGAASVIKTYSPNLMVHPLMRQTPHSMSAPSHSSAPTSDTDPKQVAKGIIDMLPRLHVLVIGPGLGRDPLMHETCAQVLAAARERKMPVVLDADALSIVLQSPELVMGWREIVLTPNVVEFGRLWKGLINDDDSELKSTSESAQVEKLSKKLGGVTIVQKGGKDFISNGETTLVVDAKGGLKRSGGQGDTLTGSIATFLAWRLAYHDGLWDHGGELKEEETLRLAAFGGATITRECSRRAFEKKGRSLQASDLTEEVHIAFMNLLGEQDG